MSFASLGIIEPILKALHEEGYRTPTPIQKQTIPLVLKGDDVLGVAQTGTGKTAAFAIPILQFLATYPSHTKEKVIRSLVLTPTRELAIQIEESIIAYGRHLPVTSVVIFGGVRQWKQTEALQKGVDIVVATPGRLLDLMEQGHVDIAHVEMFVLDEADRMLDMGFIDDVRKIIDVLPLERQSMFFSATMIPAIARLADDILYEPVRVEVSPVSSTVDLIQQELYYVSEADKLDLLMEILKDPDIERALVFTRTKHGADNVARTLSRNRIPTVAIHGDKEQFVRQRGLKAFKDYEIQVLVATDIAARGLDVDDLEYVINFEIPTVPETYVHRIGRTGRAGAAGTAISLCSDKERSHVRSIERLIGKRIPVMYNHPFAKVERQSDRSREAPRSSKTQRTEDTHSRAQTSASTEAPKQTSRRRRRPSRRK